MSLRPNRIPILYLILGVLLLVSVVPMYFYANLVVDKNRERLKTNEMLLQNTVTKSLSDDLAHRQTTLRMMLENLASAVTITSGGDLNGDHVASPEMRALLEKFVTTYGDLAYATLLNSDAKGIDAGKIQPDAFLQKELEVAFTAARDGRPYTGNPVSIGSGKDGKTLLLVGQPLEAGGHFIGMVATVLDLQFLTNRLREASQGGLMLYIVDRQGRLVSEGDGSFATGQDMNRFEIVKKFVEQGGRARFIETSEFIYKQDRNKFDMLGTYSPVPSLEWAVIAQKDQHQAYASVYEMQRYSRLLALLAVLLSVGISSFAARNIAKPLEQLTISSRAIASGDFSQRVHVSSRTEIGELAMTFNHMT
ncbi:MAG: HAMP domain-containing protein, partial [Acidobacteriaceae bacterium]